MVAQRGQAVLLPRSRRGGNTPWPGRVDPGRFFSRQEPGA